MKRVTRGHEMRDAIQDEFDMALVRFPSLSFKRIEHFPEESIDGLAA